MRKVIHWVLICLFASSTSRSAHADAQDQMIQAQELIAKARERLRQGELRGAIALYEEANRIVPTPDYLFAIASIHSRIEGNCMDTIKAWTSFVQSCRACSRRAKGLKKMERHQKLCKVMINIKSTPSGADVSFDDQVIGTTPVSLPTIAGKHKVKWSLAEYHPHESEIILLKGSELTVKRVTLIPIDKSAQESLMATKRPPPSTTNALTQRVVERDHNQGKWTWLATSGVITSLGVVGILLAYSEVDQMNNAESDLDFERLERDSSYKLKQGLGYAGVGIGLGILSYSLLRFEF